MIGDVGIWKQPKGTWSDDSSLTLCLAESLLQGLNLQDVATKFIQWVDVGLWTARGSYFDIGNATRQAIQRLDHQIRLKQFSDKLEDLTGSSPSESENGNGCLMRILPLLFYIKDINDIQQQFEIVWKVSALTHRHIRAAMSCMIYLKLAEHLLRLKSQPGDNSSHTDLKMEPYRLMRNDIVHLWDLIEFDEKERAVFERVITNDILSYDKKTLRSGCYVIESIEASIWCFLKYDSYKEIVLNCINLGHDTDTTAAIGGGLAGLFYGIQSNQQDVGSKGIPQRWLQDTARVDDILELGKKLHQKYFNPLNQAPSRVSSSSSYTDKDVQAVLLGVCAADAVGVPYESIPSQEICKHPCTDMIRDVGVWKKPKGTWSDDGSLTLCLAESLLQGLNLQDVATKFIQWVDVGLWTARGDCFGIGNATRQSIVRLGNQIRLKQFSDKLEDLTGSSPSESENGNGCLMRILPLLFYIKDINDIQQQFEIVWKVSALTHRHIRAAMSCMIYLKLAEHLLRLKSQRSHKISDIALKMEAYRLMRNDIVHLWDLIEFDEKERAVFERVITNDILSYSKKTLKSGCYVIESIEASIWCFLKYDSYKEIVLNCINLGHDTDTTAAIGGGLAGLFYGIQSNQQDSADEDAEGKGIPQRWLQDTARVDDILELGKKSHQKYFSIH